MHISLSKSPLGSVGGEVPRGHQTSVAHCAARPASSHLRGIQIRIIRDNFPTDLASACLVHVTYSSTLEQKNPKRLVHDRTGAKSRDARARRRDGRRQGALGHNSTSKARDGRALKLPDHNFQSLGLTATSLSDDNFKNVYKRGVPAVIHGSGLPVEIFDRPRSSGWRSVHPDIFRILVYLVICDSGQVSLQQLLLSWDPS